MTNLIRTEWLKIRKYPAFWWILGITALTYPGINYMFYAIYREMVSEESATGEISKVLLGNPFAFPETWHTLAYLSSILVFIPAVVVIMFISNEYSYKTYRQNIIDGWSRAEFMTAKMINVMIISLIVTLLYFLVALYFGFSKIGGGGTGTFDQIYYIGLFALQTFAQLSIAFMIGYLVKRAFIALGIVLFYFIILENILVAVGKRYLNDAFRYLPLEISDRLIPFPAFMGKMNDKDYELAVSQMNIHILYTIILTTLVWLLCYRINKRRDL